MSGAEDSFRSKLAFVAATCACLSVRRGARAVTQFYDATLAPSGIGIAQAGLLVAIELKGATTRSDLARTLVMDRTTLARNLKLLERDGFIEVVAGNDKRVRAVALTDKGRAAVVAAEPYWREAQERLLDRVGEETWQGVRGVLAGLEELYRA